MNPENRLDPRLDPQEEALIAEFMHLAEASVDISVPDPGLVLFKAQLRARREAAQKAERPILFAYRAAAVLILLASVWAVGSLTESSALMAVTMLAGLLSLVVIAGSALWVAGRK